MGNNTELGKEGEKIAADYLSNQGYDILVFNYRYKRAEVDLIAQKDEIIIFVEVKMRSSTGFGYPEEAVSDKKAELIMEAAEHYMYETNWKGKLRFDIIAILKGKNEEIMHLEDAF